MAVHEALFHYDDCKEHFVVASKAQWDFFNRLLLLIASDAEIAVATRRSWHPSQSIAAVFLSCSSASHFKERMGNGH